jgi:hypothetical protein
VGACDAPTEETFNGGIVKVVRKAKETAFDEPKAVEVHGFDDLSMAETVGTGLRERWRRLRYHRIRRRGA